MSLFKNRAYYHASIENFIVAFGEMFSGITIRKKNDAGDYVKAYEVPIEYAPKNKWISRVKEQNNLLTNQVKITLPRIAFEMADIRYASDRKIGVNGTYAVGSITTVGQNPITYKGKIFPPTPYDVIFNLYVATKDQNDALQILEQVTPYFQPYLTMNYTILKEYNIKKDVPVTWAGYEIQDTFEGSPEEQRAVTQTFTFSAQMDFFGPMFVTDKVIQEIDVNFWLNKTDAEVHSPTKTPLVNLHLIA